MCARWSDGNSTPFFPSYAFSWILGNNIFPNLCQQGFDSTDERILCKIWKVEEQQKPLMLLQASSWASAEGHMWNPASRFPASSCESPTLRLWAVELTGGGKSALPHLLKINRGFSWPALPQPSNGFVNLILLNLFLHELL